jgi:hypothetical protein
VGRAVGPFEILASHSLQQSWDVLGRRGEVLDSDDTLKDSSGVGVLGRDGDDPGAVDEVDSSHEGDVLPDLRMRIKKRKKIVLSERIRPEAGTKIEGKRRTLVSPGIGATVQTFFFLRVLMMLLLPTLGYPMKPTEICFLSEWRTENWRRSWMREPLPNELLIEAWKARVGASLERCLTQRAWKREDTKIESRSDDGSFPPNTQVLT